MDYALSLTYLKDLISCVNYQLSIGELTEQEALETINWCSKAVGQNMLFQIDLLDDAVNNYSERNESSCMKLDFIMKVFHLDHTNDNLINKWNVENHLKILEDIKETETYKKFYGLQDLVDIIVDILK